MPERLFQRAATAALLVFVLAACDEERAPDAPLTATPSPAVTATPAAGGTPTATPTATPGGPDSHDDLTLLTAPGLLEFVRDETGEVPQEPGIFFLDVHSGVLEGWHAAGDGETPFRPPFLFAYSADNRFVAARGVIADRGTGTVYRWEGDAAPVHVGGFGDRLAFEPLAAAGGRVLFLVRRDTFAVVDFAPEPAVTTTFEAEGGYGLISRDGSRVVVAGGPIQVVDLQTGHVDQIGVIPGAQRGLHFRLHEHPDGDGFLVLGVGGRFSDWAGTWRHYRWDGELIAEGEAPAERFHLSPGGEFLAWTEESRTPGRQHAHPGVPVVYAVDASTGSPVFRVVGASTCLDATEGNRWLADGSGLVVLAAGAQAIATVDGRVHLLPFGGEPIPSPGLASIFAVDRGTVALNAAGDVMARVRIAESGIVREPYIPGPRSWVQPWSADGREIRFMNTQNGHGRSCERWSGLVVPRVEHPPYDDPPVVRLSEQAAGAALVDEAGGVEVIGRLAEPLEVTVLEVATSEEASTRDRDIWGLVRDAHGQEGWLLLRTVAGGP